MRVTKNLGSTTFKTIGVALPRLKGIFFSAYYNRILSGIADAILESEYRFKLVMLKPDKRWDDYDFRVGEGIDGLIMTHWPNFFSSKFALQKLRLPCVVLNDPEPGLRVCFVAADNVKGGKLAAAHLYSKGHRKIAVMTGPKWSSDSGLRVKGFRSFFEKKGKPCELTFFRGDFHEEKAFELAEKIARGHSVTPPLVRPSSTADPHRGSLPHRLFSHKCGGSLRDRNKQVVGLRTNGGVTAVFCCNDLMAFGVLKKFSEMGIRCPEDISIVGYDDDARAQYSKPPLTTIRVPAYELAREGTRRILEALKKGEKRGCARHPLEGILFPVELKERESVRKIH